MGNSIGHFSLWGDFEAAEVTAALDIEPSRVYPKGTLFEGANFPALTTTWDFYCPPDKTMNEQVDFLMTSLWPRAAAVRPLSSRFKAEMNISGSCEDGAQVLNLSPEMLQKLLSLNITLNCFYSKDEEDGD